MDTITEISLAVKSVQESFVKNNWPIPHAKERIDQVVELLTHRRCKGATCVEFADKYFDVIRPKFDKTTEKLTDEELELCVLHAIKVKQAHHLIFDLHLVFSTFCRVSDRFILKKSVELDMAELTRIKQIFYRITTMFNHGQSASGVLLWELPGDIIDELTRRNIEFPPTIMPTFDAFTGKLQKMLIGNVKPPEDMLRIPSDWLHTTSKGRYDVSKLFEHYDLELGKSGLSAKYLERTKVLDPDAEEVEYHAAPMGVPNTESGLLMSVINQLFEYKIMKELEKPSPIGVLGDYRTENRTRMILDGLDTRNIVDSEEPFEAINQQLRGIIERLFSVDAPDVSNPVLKRELFIRRYAHIAKAVGDVQDLLYASVKAVDWSLKPSDRDTKLRFELTTRLSKSKKLMTF